MLLTTLLSVLWRQLYDLLHAVEVKWDLGCIPTSYRLCQLGIDHLASCIWTQPILTYFCEQDAFSAYNCTALQVQCLMQVSYCYHVHCWSHSCDSLCLLTCADCGTAGYSSGLLLDFNNAFIAKVVMWSCFVFLPLYVLLNFFFFACEKGALSAVSLLIWGDNVEWACPGKVRIFILAFVHSSVTTQYVCFLHLVAVCARSHGQRAVRISAFVPPLSLGSTYLFPRVSHLPKCNVLALFSREDWHRRIFDYMM